VMLLCAATMEDKMTCHEEYTEIKRTTYGHYKWW
jgi:hypothetical protein